MRSRPVLLAFLAGAAVVALVATTVISVVQTRRVATERARADALAADVAKLEAEVERLEEEAASGGDLGGLLDGLLGGGGDLGDLGGLFGGEGGDDLGGLLDGLLGGDGDLGGLLGAGGSIPGIECMTPGGGGLDGLLGGGGDLGGLLDGLLGGGGGGDALPDDPDDLVDTIADQVAEMRELEFSSEVDVAFLDDDEIAAELEAILDEDLDLDELDAQAAVLVALRAIPGDADLEELNRDLLEGQVAGFYSPDEERLVVRTSAEGIRPIDRVTLAHELEHALADQAIGLPDLADGLDADAALARLSVVEGDATLLMNFWTLEHLSFADQMGMAMSSDFAASQEQLDGFPHHLQRELLFSYTAGLDLACDLWQDGGWGAIDDAYVDPPTTTAGVLFADRRDEGPGEVPSLSAPAGGQERLSDTFGAAPLSWLFEAPGGDTGAALDEPLDRAAAWGAGGVSLWDVDGAPVVGLALRDRDAGDPALCGSVTDWYAAAAPDAERDEAGGEVRFTDGTTTAVVACDGDEVRVGIAADATAAGDVVD